MDRCLNQRALPRLSGLLRLLVVAGLGCVAVTTTAFASEPCGSGTYPFPYTDVASVGNAFCPGIMEAYVTGISKGTSGSTFSPNDDVIRLQMTTFLQRTVDQVLTRGSRRAALKQWWTPQNTDAMQTISIGLQADYCATDGKNIWASNGNGDQVVEVQASTGKILGAWTGALGPGPVVAAAGKIYVTTFSSPGILYVLDPTQPPGALTTAASNLGANPNDIAFDGTYIWTANSGGSVSIITPQASTPYPVTTISAGFTHPSGILYDGANLWVADAGADNLFKLDPTGAIIQTITVGAAPYLPAFDGTNIWVPNAGDSTITVVQASTGNVVATITSDLTNNLSAPVAASFDGERILVVNENGNSVTVFKAADLSFIANVTTGASTAPGGACSDGINFWIGLVNTGNLLRF